MQFLKNYGHLLAVAFLIALSFALRVIPVYNTVFTPDGVMLLENDPYYHIRLAEYLLANFPLPLTHDIFIGGELPYFPLMSYLITMPASMLDCSLEAWAAWIPPFTIIPILIVAYLLGKMVAGKWTGVLATAVVAFLPTELFHRSLLGFSDHHVLEVLFVSLIFLYLLSADRTSRIRKYGFLGGVALSLYIWCWKGFPLYLLLITAISVLVILFRRDGNRSIGSFHLLSGVIGLLALLPLFVYYHLPAVYILSVLLYTVVPYLIIRLKEILGLKLSLSILFCAAVGLAFAFKNYITWTLFPVVGVGHTISEASPGVLYMFTIMGVGLAPCLLGAWALLKRRDTISLVLLFWLVAALFLFAIQMRWSYYFSIPFALVTTVGIRSIILSTKPHIRLGVAILLIALVLLPSIASVQQITSTKPLYTPELKQAIEWMGEHTPEPFGNSDNYLSSGLMQPDYTVMSHWPLGFYIIYGGHRVPVTDPTQRDADVAARFFIYGEGDPAYVLINDDMKLTFPGMAQILGSTWEEGELLYNVSYLKQFFNRSIDTYSLVFDNEQVQVWERISK